MATPSGLPPRPKGERSIVKARFDGTRQRKRRPCAPLLEGTRQRTRRSCAHLQKIDTEKDAGGGSRQKLTTGSDFLLGNTWEQDQAQDACLPVYRPLENKTEKTNGLISAPETRTPSAAHQTIESAAESEIGPETRHWQGFLSWGDRRLLCRTFPVRLCRSKGRPWMSRTCSQAGETSSDGAALC